MKYCDECAEKYDIFKTDTRVEGVCELCEEVTVCSERDLFAGELSAYKSDLLKVNSEEEEEDLTNEERYMPSNGLLPAVLTSLEVTTLQHRWKGLNNGQVAELMGLGKRTVDSRMDAIRGKWGVNNSTLCFRIGLALGLLSATYDLGGEQLVEKEESPANPDTNYGMLKYPWATMKPPQHSFFYKCHPMEKKEIQRTVMRFGKDWCQKHEPKNTIVSEQFAEGVRFWKIYKEPA